MPPFLLKLNLNIGKIVDKIAKLLLYPIDPNNWLGTNHPPYASKFLKTLKKFGTPHLTDWINNMSQIVTAEINQGPLSIKVLPDRSLSSQSHLQICELIAKSHSINSDLLIDRILSHIKPHYRNDLIPTSNPPSQISAYVFVLQLVCITKDKWQEGFRASYKIFLAKFL
jgi:hypothetical protein